MSNVSEGKLDILSQTSAKIEFDEQNIHVGNVEDGTEILWFTVDPPDPNPQFFNETLIVVSIIHEAGRNERNFTQLPLMLSWLRDEVVFVVNEAGAAVK